jgi:hypothetical protein
MNKQDWKIIGDGLRAMNHRVTQEKKRLAQEKQYEADKKYYEQYLNNMGINKSY